MKLIEESLKIGWRELLLVSDTDGKRLTWKVLRKITDSAIEVLFDDVDKLAALRLFIQQSAEMLDNFHKEMQDKIKEVNNG